MQDDQFFDAADIKALKQPHDAAQKHGLVHIISLISALVSFTTIPLLYPLSIFPIWLLSNTLKKQYPSIEDHARKVVNFHISISCFTLISLGIVYALMGMIDWEHIASGSAVMFIPFFLLVTLMPINKAWKAFKGEEATEYPLTYSFFKRPKV